MKPEAPHRNRARAKCALIGRDVHLGQELAQSKHGFSLQLIPAGLYTELNMVLAPCPAESQLESDRSKEQFFRLKSVRTAVIGILAFQHQAKAPLSNFLLV